MVSFYEWMLNSRPTDPGLYSQKYRKRMTVGWLIDAGIFDAYHDELAAAVTRQGHSVVSVNRPNPPYEWDDTGSSYRNAFPDGSCVIAHADIDLVSRVIDDKIWTPGTFATVPNFFCSHYYAHFGLSLIHI